MKRYNHTDYIQKVFSPVCVLMCDFTLPDLHDAYLQRTHLYAFSPVCVLTCFHKSPLVVEAKSHCWHLLVFTILCLIICAMVFLAFSDT